MVVTNIHGVVILLTYEQVEVLHRKYALDSDGSPTFTAFSRRIIVGVDCIMIKWYGTWLSIEKDGCVRY